MFSLYIFWFIAILSTEVILSPRGSVGLLYGKKKKKKKWPKYYSSQKRS